MVTRYVRKRTPMLDGRAVNVEVTEAPVVLLCVFKWRILFFGEALYAGQKGIVETPSAQHTIGIAGADAKLLLHVIKYDEGSPAHRDCVNLLLPILLRPDTCICPWLDPVAIETLKCSAGDPRKLLCENLVKVFA